MVDATLRVNTSAPGADRTASSLNSVATAGEKAARSAQRVDKALATASARAHTVGTQMNKASLYTANLGAQFNDIGVMLAAGQSPLMLAIQQGTQINQVMAQIGGTAKDKAAAFKAAIGSMFNSTSLLTIGVIAAGAAVGQFALRAIRSVSDVMDLEDAVKAADEAMQSFGDAADDVSMSFSGLLKEFGSASPALRVALQDIAAVEKMRAAEALDDMAKSVAGLVTNLSWWDDRSAQSAAQDFLGLSSLGSTSRETAAEFARLLVVLEQSADASERLQAAVDLRQMLFDATDGFTKMNEAQTEFRLNNAYVIRNAEILGGKLKEIGDGEGARYAALIKSYSAYADARIKSVEKIAEAEEEAAKFAEAGVAALLDQAAAAKKLENSRQAMLAALEREMEINEAILAYGADSVQVAEAKRDAHLEAAEAELLAKGYTEEIVSETMKAVEAAYDLARAVDAAADNAKRYANSMSEASRYYADTARPSDGMGNVSDDYKSRTSSASSGHKLDLMGGPYSSGISFKLYIPEEQELREYFSFVEGSLSDIDKQLNDFAKDNKGKMSEAIMNYSGSDPQKFWESFRNLAIDNYGNILETLFSSDGAATNAIGKSLETLLNGYVGRINAQISKFNTAVQNINPMDAVRRIGGSSVNGGYLRIDLDKFKGMETSFWNEKIDVIGSSLKGQLGGRDGRRSWAQLITELEKTRGVNINDTGVNINDTGINTDVTSFNDGLTLDTGLNINSLGNNRLSLDDVTANNTYTQTIKDVQKLDGVSKIFRGIVGDIQDRVRLFGKVVGGNVEGMAKVLHKFKISLGKDGKAGGKLAKLVAEEFEEYTDKLSRRVLKGRDELKRAGESWTDALERIAQDFVGVTATMKMIGGFQFNQNLNGASSASDLVKQFGGIDAFNESAMAYFSTAFSSDQQNEAITKYIRDVLESAGIRRMPRDRQEYQDLVNKFDLTTKGGQRKYAALVSLAELFDMVLPAWDAAEDSARNSANKGESWVLKRLDNMISKAKEAQSAYARLADSLAGAADSMRKSALTPAQSFQVLRREFEQFYAKGLTGDIDALEAVGGAASAYIDAYANQATNAADLRYQTAVTANKLDQLSDTAKVGEALSEYQVKQLEKLSEQVADGKIRNQLVQNVVDAVGGLGGKLFGAIGALFEAQTGNKLTAVNRDDGSVSVKVKDDDQLSYLSNVTADLTSGGGGGGGGGSVTAVVSTSTDNKIDRLRTELKTLIRKEIRTIRRGNRYEKRSMRTLEDIYENGLP